MYEYSWLYLYIFNTKWFAWTIVIIITAANVLSPIILWFVVNGLPIWNKKNKKDSKTNDSKAS